MFIGNVFITNIEGKVKTKFESQIEVPQLRGSYLQQLLCVYRIIYIYVNTI